jgi:hypothetical protein
LASVGELDARGRRQLVTAVYFVKGIDTVEVYEFRRRSFINGKRRV